jgi:DNA mismatch repair protein MutS
MARRNPAETPLMRQFLDVKDKHPDGIVFFRMGDFYEMFFEDAVIAAQALDLTLTSRDKGKQDAIPMCGVPHHAGRAYIARMTELGHKVVICEQVEDPKQAKGLVRREVVRIVTPGCVLDDEVLDPKSARYVAAVAIEAGGRFGLAYLDVSTGEFRATELADLASLSAEVSRVGPREVLATGPELAGPLAELVARYKEAVYSQIEPLSESERADALDGLGDDDHPLATTAAARAVAYARATQPGGTLPLSRLQLYDPASAVVLDEAAIANLELCRTLMGGKKQGSLLSVIDRTQTATGGRMLKRWLLYPLTEVAPIRRRQDAVEYLVEHAALRTELRKRLREVYDLERLAGRVTLGVATPRDLGRLAASLRALPELAKLVQSERVAAVEVPPILEIDEALLASLAELADELGRALVDDPPPMLPTAHRDTSVIRDGYCPIVDERRRLALGGKDEIRTIEAREREAAGIPSLKIKYNKVFGYYIEVTRTHLARVPEHYTRKQTIANGERYVTVELANLESKILSAQEALVRQEAELFARLCDRAAQSAQRVIAAGQRIACLDACASLADVAHEAGYVRPLVDDTERLEITEGRHPVVETTVPTGEFVPNDCRLDTTERQLLLITGPNMAGKSTYMRQVAHIVLLSQIGSFVPASSARVGRVDRIFTRVGASDNLARGDSTFMVEMRETAAILAGATRRSLVVLDEVGRGTSTFDGVSIAWAVSEYLHDAIGARTLFATHYHELCALAACRARVHNVSVAVREHHGKIVFLRQVVDGGSNRSYGIDVARLAGLPGSVIARSRQILGELESGKALAEGTQLSLFRAATPVADDPIRARLTAIDAERTTPFEALRLLAELKEDL